MAEPFSGAHWGKGYDEEVLSGWTDSSSGSEDSSSDNEEIVTPALERMVNRQDAQRRETDARLTAAKARLETAKEALKALEGSYWRTGGEQLDAVRDGLFGWRDLNTGALLHASFLLQADTSHKHRCVVCEDVGRNGQDRIR